MNEAGFWNKVSKSDGCWIWTGALAGPREPFMYGTLIFNGIKTLAHRLSFKLAYGEFEPSLHVCHKCDNPKCVRPDHLFLGTQKQNMLDMAVKGRAPSSNAQKTHCLRGHEFTETNTLWLQRDGKQRRHCRICQNQRQREWKQRNRA